MTRHFTGRHMTLIMVAFFGVVVGVNLLMARLAVGTFGGTVVDNSYVASQKFNGWLAEARAEQLMGWTVTATLGQDRRVRLTATAKGLPLAGAKADADAIHPLGRMPSKSLNFVSTGEGVWTSTEALPAGRWTIQLNLSDGGKLLRKRITLP